MKGPDLLALVLTLRPVRPGAPPPNLGRAAHAVLLDAIRQFDPALSDDLHHGPSTGSPVTATQLEPGQGSGPRPFTASGLIGSSRRHQLSPERTYALRFTALTSAVAQALQAAAEGGRLSLGEEVHLLEYRLRIERLAKRPEEHPWAGTTSYAALASPWLLGRVPPKSRVALLFASPTTFKSGGLHVPIPLPALVFGSLLDKWNAFSPVALPIEVRRFAQECVALTAYRLSTRMPPSKDGGLRAGAVGMARYTAVNHDPYWLSALNLLADFAFYAGVGAGTTMGFGQCRRIEDLAGQRAAQE